MGMFAVKNDKGEWLSFDGTQTGIWYSNNPTLFKDKLYADAQSIGRKAHVVELVETPEKVAVSEEEAKMLKKAKDTTVWLPAAVISDYAYNAAKDSDQEALLEDRLMRAYVNGYTVAKEKKYNVKVPLVQAQEGLWFYISSDDKLDATYIQELAKKFTMDEIEENGLQDCEKTEVEQDAE